MTAEDKKKSVRGSGFVASFSVLVVWYVFYVICWYGLKGNSYGFSLVLGFPTQGDFFEVNLQSTKTKTFLKVSEYL